MRHSCNLNRTNIKLCLYVLMVDMVVGIMIVCAIGFMAFGWKWKKGLFWFWTPIFALPLYLYAIGIIQYYPGGSKAYVETYYQSTCGIGSNGMKQCTWRGPVVKPPF